MRRGFTLVELAVAMLVMGVVIVGGAGSLKFFTRPAGQADVTTDELNAFQVAGESLDHDVREARSVIYPAPGAAPAQMLILRTFDGRQLVYYHTANSQELRRVLLDPSASASGDANASGALALTKLPDGSFRGCFERVYFKVGATGLVSWGLFSPHMFVLSAAARENR